MPSGERRAQLIAAAEALRTWVHDRRDSWPVRSPELDNAPVVAPAAVKAPMAAPQIAAPAIAIPRVRTPDTAPVADIAPVVDIAPAVETAPAADIAPPVDAAPIPDAAPVAQLPQAQEPIVRGAVLRARFSREPFIQWSKRLSIAAALAAIVGVTGWAARGYWLNVAATPRIGTAVFESAPAASDVFVDGIAVGKTPITTQLATGHHIVEFRRRNATRKIDIEIATGRSTVQRVDWSAKATGRLQVESKPAGAKVIIDGRERGVTPLEVDDLTIGSHAVVITSDSGSLRRTVQVAADRTARVSEAIYSGWVHVSSPIELEISEGARTIHLDGRNQALLPPGTHELRFENALLGYRETRRVDISPGDIASISIAPPPSPLTVTSTVPAEVFIDGARAGETPLTDYGVSLGTRDIVVKSASGERRMTVTVTAKPVRLDIDFAKPF